MRKKNHHRKDTRTQKGTLPETRKDIPHGHGAHVNEKESNAQEDYPGPKETANKRDKE